MDEAPLLKPEAKFLNHSTRIPRPISSGYELKQDIAPEIKRNLPSELNENKAQKLNINAAPFVPKIKHPGANENKNGYTEKTFRPSYNKSYHMNNNMNNMNNMNGMNPMNNMNSNTNYYPPYYGNTPYQGQQYQYQNNYYGPSYNYNMNNMPNAPPINNQYRNMNNSNAYEYSKPQFSQPLTKSYNTQTHTKQNNGKIALKLTQNSFIPKSKRENNPKPSEEPINLSSLNKDAPEYIPQNETLKKKEEEIKKQKEKEKEKEKEREEKEREEKEREEKEREEKEKEEKERKEAAEKENAKKEEKKEEQKPNKESEKEEKKNRTKSNLFMLLESKDDGNKKNHKEKTKQIGNDKSDNTSSYKNKKKQKTLVEQKIEQVNTKGKKWKEEEERQKEEERKRKEEEEKIRREEEKKRKEEERKKREEEERKREEEEKRRRKEEEQKRKEEEERRKQMELEEQKRREEEEKNKVIEKKYFIVFKNRKSEKKEYKYTFEYIMQFKNWKISKEDELLTDNVKQHFKNFEEEEREGGKRKKNDGKINKNRSSAMENSQQPKTGLTNTETPANSMEKWARKDMTKEIKAAEEYKQKLEETIKDDPIKRNLRGFLNMLTKDNYDQIKQDILGVIKDNVDYQIKFLDVLFQKAVLERAYVALYAKLCKELDKELPQKNAPKEQKKDEKKPKKETSIMRAKLLDKCKEIFQIKKNENFDQYIKEKDPQEREYKLKKFVLGNVYFITELIKIKILSKKIAPVCINNLFERYEKSKTDEKLKLINLQAVVIFTEQFGSLVHSQEKKIDSKEAENFKESIDKIFQKLDQVKDKKGLPGYIKYSIINLIEKRKNNYQMTKYQKYLDAKSKKEVEKELEEQDKITQDDINEKMKKGLSDYKDFIEEEGTSEKYPWKETTYLYDKKEKELGDILEGYIEACGDFIDRQSNVKYAKSYIKELIEYYCDRVSNREKTKLKDKLIDLFKSIRELALDIPQIYDVYAYIIYIFLENDIMKVSDLKEIITEKDSTEEDLNIVSSIFQKVYNLYKINKFKLELAEFSYIKKNKDLFEWVFNQDENEEDEEKDEE